MKNAFVTGGSRGIGAAVVRSFSKNGYTVAFTYKNSDMEAEALAKEFGAMAIRADSEKPDDIMRAAALASEKLGFIECLVNNAAISSFSLLSDLSYEEWNKTLAVNLTAPFLYSKAFIPFFGLELIPTSSSRKKSFMVKNVIRGTAADELGFSENDKLVVGKVKLDDNNKYLIAQVSTQRKKKGFMLIMSGRWW